MSRTVGWDEVYKRIAAAPPGRLYGIPRGGAIVAGLTGRAVDDIRHADWIVDDVIDTGRTKHAVAAMAQKPIWSLFELERDGVGDAELVFPWEGSEPATRQAKLERLGSELLRTLGYDPNDAALRMTPVRWARWWSDFIDFQPGRFDTSFEFIAGGQMVVVAGIPLWSVCEHHLLPFKIEVAIAYVPARRVLGLSKFVRVAQRAAHRLQLQERLVQHIALAVSQLSGTEDVAVVARGRHQCMEARGVKTSASATSLHTSGVFRARPDMRNDFLLLAQHTNPQDGAQPEPPSRTVAKNRIAL